MLAYVYWESNNNGIRTLVINEATLAGSCIGMVLFGNLADRYGRKSLYGVELVIVIIATLGLTQASSGYDHTSAYSGRTPMSIFPWLIFWRCLLGIGIGAEYPLSALIASEWSSTEVRGRMLAAVFAMQPLGQLAAYLVGYGALHWISARWGLSHDELSHDLAAPVIDAIWRCVIGVGSIPAVIAIFARWSIPETPRFLLEMEEEQQAFNAAHWMFNISPEQTIKDINRTGSATSLIQQKTSQPSDNCVSEEVPMCSGGIIESSEQRAISAERTETYVALTDPATSVEQAQTAPISVVAPSPVSDIVAVSTSAKGKQIEKETADTIESQSEPEGEGGEVAQLPKDKDRQDKDKKKFLDEWRTKYRGKGFWSILIAVSSCWFILDICFCGLGLDNPRTIANIWTNTVPDTLTLPDWRANLASPNETIWNALNGDARRALYTIPISSVLGSVIIVTLINLLPRVTFLAMTFLALAGLFLITGGTLIAAYGGANYGVTIAFYSLALFVQNLGPNTIIFMLPAELFPTKYRGTCYGIAAASGKLGAIVIQVIVSVLGNRVTHPSHEKYPLAGMLMAFAPLMLLGALIASVWIPEVQDPRTARDAKTEQSDKDTFRDWLPLNTRKLEDISKDPRKGQTIGLKANIEKLLHPNHKSLSTSAA